MNYKSVVAVVTSLLISSSLVLSACKPCLTYEERKMKDIVKTMFITDYAHLKNAGKVDASIVNKWTDLSKKYGLDLDRAVSKDGRTLLMFAAVTGHFTPVRTLRKEGVDMNAQDKKGLSALNYARMAYDSRMVDYLKKYGARDAKRKQS